MLPDHHASCKGVLITIHCHYLVARQMQVAPLPGPGADNSLGLRDPRCSDRGMSAFRRITVTIIAQMSRMASIPRRAAGVGQWPVRWRGRAGVLDGKFERQSVTMASEVMVPLLVDIKASAAPPVRSTSTHREHIQYRHSCNDKPQMPSLIIEPGKDAKAKGSKASGGGAGGRSKATE